MKIVITTPSLKTPHGGTRILNEWASRLSIHHHVTLFVETGNLKCDWYDLPKTVKISRNKLDIKNSDCLIIGSPHSIGLQKYAKGKCFLFLQMLEHLFNPANSTFELKCRQFYKSAHPMFSISKWNMDYLEAIGRTGPTHYIGNGVNLEHFPINVQPKENIVLVEGWECTNHAKDVQYIAPKVAKRLKDDGFKILAFSQLPLKTFVSVPDEYYHKPTLHEMNNLYSRAKILLKATQYDARSTAPLEAMTKGTPTVRAIINGDDDLVHMYNCLRVDYDEEQLYTASRVLLDDEKIYKKLSKTGLEYIQKYNWDYWMGEIRKCIEG